MLNVTIAFLIRRGEKVRKLNLKDILYKAVASYFLFVTRNKNVIYV